MEHWGTAGTCAWCVSDAGYQFCVEKQEVFKKVFQKVGLSLPIDGNADHGLGISGSAAIDGTGGR